MTTALAARRRDMRARIAQEAQEELTLDVRDWLDTNAHLDLSDAPTVIARPGCVAFKLALPSDEAAADYFNHAVKSLRSQGIRPIDVAKRCAHNGRGKPYSYVAYFTSDRHLEVYRQDNAWIVALADLECVQ